MPDVQLPDRETQAPPAPDKVTINYPHQLGRLLHAARREHGWTMSEVARRAHMSPAMVSMVELGNRIPSLPVQIALLAAVGYELQAVRRNDAAEVSDAS